MTKICHEKWRKTLPVNWAGKNWQVWKSLVQEICTSVTSKCGVRWRNWEKIMAMGPDNLTTHFIYSSGTVLQHSFGWGEWSCNSALRPSQRREPSSDPKLFWQKSIRMTISTIRHWDGRVRRGPEVSRFFFLICEIGYCHGRKGQNCTTVNGQEKGHVCRIYCER